MANPFDEIEDLEDNHRPIRNDEVFPVEIDELPLFPPPPADFGNNDIPRRNHNYLPNRPVDPPLLIPTGELNGPFTKDQIYHQWREMQRKEGVTTRMNKFWYDAEIEMIRNWTNKPANERDSVQFTNELKSLGIKGKTYKPSIINTKVESATFLDLISTKEERNEINELVVLHPSNGAQDRKEEIML